MREKREEGERGERKEKREEGEMRKERGRERKEKGEMRKERGRERKEKREEGEMREMRGRERGGYGVTFIPKTYLVLLIPLHGSGADATSMCQHQQSLEEGQTMCAPLGEGM